MDVKGTLPLVGIITVGAAAFGLGWVLGNRRDTDGLPPKEIIHDALTELLKNRDFVGALLLSSKAINSDPKDYTFLGFRSHAYRNLAMLDDAVEDAEKVIALAPHQTIVCFCDPNKT